MRLTVPAPKTIIINASLLSYEGIYNGSNHYGGIQLTVKNATDNTLTEGTDYTISGNTDMTAAGTYTLIIEGIGTYAGSSTSVSYTVNPAVINVTAIAATKNYGEVDPALTYNVAPEHASLLSGALSREAGDDAGTYAITQGSLVPTNANYDISFSPATFTINKVNPTVTPASGKVGLAYNGNAQQLVNAGSAVGGTMVYSLNDVDYSTSIPAVVSSGNYTVYYKVLGDNNHNDTDVQSISVTITSSAAETVANMIDDLLWLPGGQVDPGNEHQRSSVLNAWNAYHSLPYSEQLKVPAYLVDWLYNLVSNTDYAIISGIGSTWYKGKSSGISFRAIDPVGKFAGVRVDGVLLDLDDYWYSGEEETCVVTLKPAYLTTLGFGRHEISICYWNGYAPGHFYVMEATGSPPTGDTANFPLWGAMLLLSGFGLTAAAATVLRRKKSEE